MWCNRWRARAPTCESTKYRLPRRSTKRTYIYASVSDRLIVCFDFFSEAAREEKKKKTCAHTQHSHISRNQCDVVCCVAAAVHTEHQIDLLIFTHIDHRYWCLIDSFKMCILIEQRQHAYRSTMFWRKVISPSKQVIFLGGVRVRSFYVFVLHCAHTCTHRHILELIFIHACVFSKFLNAFERIFQASKAGFFTSTNMYYSMWRKWRNSNGTSRSKF